MAHKTFISYKYSEAQDLRNRIIEALGEDSVFYKGETSDSPDLTDCKTETIKTHLKDMIYGTSVTIVIISPNMKQSKWIDWEIEYSLKAISRDGRTSHRNGIVAVIQKVNGDYTWFKKVYIKAENCRVADYEESLVYDIIKKNRGNQQPLQYTCSNCNGCFSDLTGSYITYVEEDSFLKNPNNYIENAFEKSQNDAAGYNIAPTR